MQEPARLDRGHFEEPQEDFGRDRDPNLIVVPGPVGDLELTGKLRPAPLAEEFDPDRPQSLRKLTLDSNRFGRVLLAGHVGSSLEPNPLSAHRSRASVDTVLSFLGPSGEPFLHESPAIR